MNLILKVLSITCKGLTVVLNELTRPSKWDGWIWTGFCILLIATLFIIFGIITGYGLYEALRLGALK